MSSRNQEKISLQYLSERLKSHDQREQILKGLCRQIDKDFSTFSVHFPLEYSEDISIEEIFHQLKPVIEQLSNENRDKLRQVIYRIDLSERRLSKVLGSTLGEQLIDELTLLIIQREMKKVISRIRHS